MRFLMFLVLVGLAVWGCSHHLFQEPYPDLLEAQAPQVSHCDMLGVVSETADAANPWSLAAEQNMIFQVRERAGQLGATHLVWLHQTDNMATAQVYRCP
jgi:hypothetical protein